ncbi:MAG: prolyl oligopeptidase family serine peptidase [Nanoarchaeota archaeon]|nr:prolyl oligopeptidase family serine peptidase [Nanoarchaeota archaeon]
MAALSTQLIVLTVILVFIGFVLFFSLLQFLMSIHPPRFYESNTPKDYGLLYENASFTTSDKINIKGWLITSETAKGTVIVGHGYPFDKGNILPVAKFLYPDYNLLFYDHRYFGESSGSITTVGFREVEDVKAAINFVHEKFGKNKSVALYGFSLSASAMLMAKPEVNAIIADSPYADLEKMITHVYRIFGPFKFPFVLTTKALSNIFLKLDPKKVSPALAIKNTSIPILLIHGEKDTQIPVENAYALKESNPNIELWIVKGADHGQAHFYNKNEYEKRVKDFLKKHME